MRDPKQIIKQFPSDGELLPLVDAIVAATGVKTATVTGSPAYRSIPRTIIAGRAYAQRDDLIAFFAGREFVPAIRTARKRLEQRRGTLDPLRRRHTAPAPE